MSTHDFKPAPWKFASNPLLPNRIAEKLRGFSKSFVKIPSDTSKDYIVMGNRKPEPQVFITIPYQFEGGLSGFQTQCKAISKEIKDWLKAHGLEDLNQHVVDTGFDQSA